MSTLNVTAFPLGGETLSRCDPSDALLLVEKFVKFVKTASYAAALSRSRSSGPVTRPPHLHSPRRRHCAPFGRLLSPHGAHSDLWSESHDAGSAVTGLRRLLLRSSVNAHTLHPHRKATDMGFYTLCVMPIDKPWIRPLA
jgi:hypothetical protein